MITATRYHDISCGHRVHGHENKCRHFHGHNYRVTFDCAAIDDSIPLDGVGRVLDFSVIKSELCMWLEDNWDHKFLLWQKDPYWSFVDGMCPTHKEEAGFLSVPFNPTAENMAEYLLWVIGPKLLAPHGVKLVKVTVEETRKCSASAEMNYYSK